MLPIYQQIISCQQLHELLFPTASSNDKDVLKSPITNLLILDASIPPVGKMQQPDKQWPDYALPNARRFDLNKNFSDLSSLFPHTMPSINQFQQQAQILGVSNDTQIIIYDDQGLFSAARAWYMFKAMGHKNVAVLDGGLPAWLELGFPVSSATTLFQERGNFAATFNKEYFCSSKYIYQQLNSPDSLVVDARANERFEGKVAEPREGIRSGHIPNSVNLPFTDLLSNGLLFPIDSLKDKFKEINKQNRPMMMSCGSGVTACVLALVAEICGYKQVKVYDGSWSEWGADQKLPLVTGPK